MSPDRGEKPVNLELKHLYLLRGLFGKVEDERELPSATSRLLRSNCLLPCPLSLQEDHFPEYTVSEIKASGPVYWVKKSESQPRRAAAFPADFVNIIGEQMDLVTVGVENLVPNHTRKAKIRARGEARGLCLTGFNGAFDCDESGSRFERLPMILRTLDPVKHYRIWTFKPEINENDIYSTTISLWERKSAKHLIFVLKARFFLMDQTLEEVLEGIK
jgi:hypothetical protein